MKSEVKGTATSKRLGNTGIDDEWWVRKGWWQALKSFQRF